MKINIYELLGMIKDDKAPRKIVFKEEVYTFDYEAYDYIATNGDGLFDYYATPRIIDDEVTILETTITHNQDEPTFKEIDGEWYVRTDFRPDGNIVFVEKAKQDKIEKIEQRVDTGLIGSESLDMIEHTNRINRQAGYISDIVNKINEIIDYIQKGEK